MSMELKELFNKLDIHNRYPRKPNVKYGKTEKKIKRCRI